jgi:iron complex transport system ATP-binding protein
MIKAEHVRYAYRGAKEVLKDLNMSESAGHCLALLGNNGAGKSTFLKCINRILSRQGGVISVSEQDVKALSRGEIARTMAYVEQHTGVSRLTVYDTVLLGRKPHMRFGPGREDYRIVDEAIARLSLQEFQLRYVDELSGGELQKVVLARALAQQPKVLLLDEPTASLDLYNQHVVMRNVSEIAKADRLLAVVVIHDLNLALQYCDRFMLIHDGFTYRYGDASVITEESIREVYRVPASILTVKGRPFVVVDTGIAEGEEIHGA